jgi:hypothetical protein
LLQGKLVGLAGGGRVHRLQIVADLVCKHRFRAREKIMRRGSGAIMQVIVAQNGRLGNDWRRITPLMRLYYTVCCTYLCLLREPAPENEGVLAPCRYAV